MSAYYPTDVSGGAFKNISKQTIKNVTTVLDGSYVNETGDIMTGNLDMSLVNKVTELADPTDIYDAANKHYVDNKTWDASKIISGTLNDSRLSNNIANVTFVNTHLWDASSITTGTFNDARISNNIATKTYVDSKNWDATTIVSGILNDLRLSSNIANKTYVDNKTWNASTIVSGILDDARLSTNIVRFTDLGLVVSTVFDRYLNYKFILDSYKPTFWLSGFYYAGLKMNDNVIRAITYSIPTFATDLVTGTITNGISQITPTEYSFTGTNSVTSTAQYSTSYTFFFLMRRTLISGFSGRSFTSNATGSNRLFGTWNVFNRCWFATTDIWGVNSNQTAADLNYHLYIGRNSNNTKKFYDGNTTVFASSTNGDNAWGGVVIGQPAVFTSEAGQFNLKEVICFNYDMTDLEINNVRNFIAKYHSFV